MANPSISIDDEVLEDFDKIIEKKEQELPAGASLHRSNVLQDLMEDWIVQNEEYLEGEGNVRGTTAD